MRIINNNFCNECAYFIEECDNYGLCCKNDEYDSVKPNQSACNDFCGDNNEYDDVDDYIANTQIDDAMFDEENADIY